MNDNVLAVLLSTADSRQFCGTITGSTDFQKIGGGEKPYTWNKKKGGGG